MHSHHNPLVQISSLRMGTFCSVPVHKCDIIFYIQIKKLGLRINVCVKQKENKSKNERKEEV